ncbi:fasciclin domain-containing protein [Spirosoma soli]|uniref:Fasciclin domain-containing protein n=1 Tax=Spirosoma soli TaxID=1770529 RepID=A0ABW5MF76_9BACT
MHLTHRMPRGRQLSLLSVLFMALAVSFWACNTADNDDNLPPRQTVAEFIASNNRFTLLTAAINRAGLATTLSGAGPYTVLAPSDDAFRVAGFADVAAINAAPDTTLRRILQYHVLTSLVPSSSVVTGQPALAVPTSVSTAGSVYLTRVASNSLSVNEAHVLQEDGLATNGVVYAIDRVLTPPSGNILQVVQRDTTLSLLARAATRGGTAVVSALSGTTPLTIFAPTNAAFRAIGYTSAVIDTVNLARLTSVLTYHVIPSVRAYSPTLTNGAVLTTFQSGTVSVGVSATGVTVTGRGNGTNASNVTTPNINATNGVIHKIDRVLLP